MTDARTEFFYRDPAAPTPNKPRALSVIALIELDGSLLLERRADAPVWSLVAGGVRDDEGLDTALRREVDEATGLAVASYRLFGTFSDPTRIVRYPDGNVYSVVSLAYLVDVESLEPLRVSGASGNLRFFARDVLPDLDLPATQRPIVERYVESGALPHLE